MINTPWEIINRDRDFFKKLEDVFIRKVSLELEQLSKQHGWGLPDEQALQETLKKLYEDIFFKPFDKETLKADLRNLLNLLKEFNQEILHIVAKGLVQILFEYIIFLLEQKRWELLADIFSFGEKLFSTLREFKEDIYLLLKQTFEKEIEQVIDSILRKYHIEDYNLLREVVLEVLKRKFGGKVSLQSTQATIKTALNRVLNQKASENQEVSSAERIYQLLKEIKEVDNLVELRVYYRGIPIVCKAMVKDIDPTTNWLQLEGVNCKYLIFYQPGTQIFVIHSLLPKPLLGKVFKAEPEKGIIWINALTFSEDPYEKRKSVRIELEKPIPVKVYKGLKIFKGFVKDISQKGIGIVFPEHMPPVESGNLLKIKTKIGDIEIDTFGVVRNVDRIHKKVGLEYTLPYEVEKRLLQFLFKEQNKILSKLKEVEKQENNET